MSKTGKAGGVFTKIITYILMVLLVLGVYGAIVYVVTAIVSPSGMYIEYGGESYFADNNGLSVEWENGAYTAQFYIKNTEGWGAYSAEGCTVKVVPNIDDNTNFDFTAGNGYYSYSSVSDLTVAFIENYSSYDGNGVTVDEDGGFSLYFNSSYLYSNIDNAMSVILTRIYGYTVELSETYDISKYPYFALQVTSPDGGSVVTIPFTVYGSGRVITVL